MVAAGVLNMIFRKQTVASLLLALLAASTLSASAASGLPHIGKKKPDQDLLPSRKLTPAQNALIDKAIAREKVVIKRSRIAPPSSKPISRR